MDGEGRDSGPDPLRVGGKVIDTKAGLYDILPVEEMRKQEGKRVPIRRNFTGPIIGYGTLTFNEEDGCIHIDAEVMADMPELRCIPVSLSVTNANPREGLTGILESGSVPLSADRTEAGGPLPRGQADVP
jgi:hypothetical protein